MCRGIGYSHELAEFLLKFCMKHRFPLQRTIRFMSKNLELPENYTRKLWMENGGELPDDEQAEAAEAEAPQRLPGREQIVQQLRGEGFNESEIDTVEALIALRNA